MIWALVVGRNGVLGESGVAVGEVAKIIMVLESLIKRLNLGRGLGRVCFTDCRKSDCSGRWLTDNLEYIKTLIYLPFQLRTGIKKFKSNNDKKSTFSVK